VYYVLTHLDCTIVPWSISASALRSSPVVTLILERERERQRQRERESILDAASHSTFPSSLESYLEPYLETCLET
jgi:hypothetical protein